uniref:Uncharacterized protein n=1 Tax=Molossus molossus TaxID=27622 RepID=A0A7J8I0U3_MOLMO|nr:hypothetical protein HJG59_010795 [Molossus molossus]
MSEMPGCPPGSVLSESALVIIASRGPCSLAASCPPQLCSSEAGSRQNPRVGRFPCGCQGLPPVDPPSAHLPLTTVRMHNSSPGDLLTFVNYNFRIPTLALGFLLFFLATECSSTNYLPPLRLSSFPKRDTEHLDVCIWVGVRKGTWGTC